MKAILSMFQSRMELVPRNDNLVDHQYLNTKPPAFPAVFLSIDRVLFSDPGEGQI